MRKLQWGIQIATRGSVCVLEGGEKKKALGTNTKKREKAKVSRTHAKKDRGPKSRTTTGKISKKLRIKKKIPQKKRNKGGTKQRYKKEKTGTGRWNQPSANR